MSLALSIAIWCAVVYASVLATTIYLHRTLTHRGMEVNGVAAFLFHLQIWLFTGIQPRQWVAVHRKHHQFSDKEGDPHSPRQFGLWNVFFFNAFYYRKEDGNPATVQKYTPDYRGTLLDRRPLPSTAGLILGGLIFAALWGWVWGPVLYLAQGVTYIFLNASINSICHTIGYRNFDNLATNVRWIALLTGGEGLHNNHHEYPTAAHFAMAAGEFDPAWPFIRLLEALGWARVKPLPFAGAV